MAGDESALLNFGVPGVEGVNNLPSCDALQFSNDYRIGIQSTKVDQLALHAFYA